MYEYEGRRNPVLGAPGSNDYSGLIASSTIDNGGSKSCNFQRLSENDANNLCERYLPLAYKVAGKYRDRGIAFDELRSAALAGLFEASRNYDPQRGPFGPYAKPWCLGEVTALFKEAKRRRAESLDAPLPNDSRDEPDKPKTLADKLAYIAPVGVIDMHDFADVDRKIIQARDAGETLVEVGEAVGLSPERVRQRETPARKRFKGAVAAICVSDLTSRGDILPFPRRYSWGDESFRDSPPPKHIYLEPELSKQFARHRKHAAALAELRGNSPLRNPNGPYGGPVIHAWGLPLKMAEGPKGVRLTESRRTRLLPRSTKFEIDWYGRNRCREAVPFDDMAGVECIVPKQPIGGFTILTEQGWRNLVDHQWGRP